MFRTRLLAAVLIAVLPVSAWAQINRTATDKPAATKKSDILPLDAKSKVLPNGLTVIVVPTGFPNIVSLQIPVLTGSRNEVEPGKSGFAHFFEHMMFRGTPSYSPEQYQAEMTKAGARNNAYTTDDYTNYHVTLAKEDLETILKIEADRFQNLSYAVEAFKTESRAVLGEYNKNSANPFGKIFEVQRDSAFTTHPYKHTTMGFIRDIEDMPNQFEYSKTFFDRWYRPENTAIIVAGDVTAAEVIPLVEKYWGKWKRGSFSVAIPKEPEPKGPVYAHVPWPTETLPIVMVGFHGPAFSETAKDAAALDMLLDIYFGESSEIYKRLVIDEQKADVLFYDSPANADPSLATIGVRLKSSNDAVYVRDAVMKTVAQAKASVVKQQRLEDAKSNARYSLARRFDNTEAIASTLARFVRYRRSYDTLNNVFRVYESLTPQDLLDAGRKYFTDSRLVVTTLSRDALAPAIAKAPPLSSFAPGGSTATGPGSQDIRILAKKSALPLLNVKLLFEAGSARDPKGKEGLAALSAAMISDAGSKDMRYDEITKALYPIAGSFNSQVDKEMTTLTGVIHKDNWRRFFEIALPMLLDPGFREEDFQRVKTNQMNSLVTDLRANNEEELGKEHLQGIVFRGTPYAHTVRGTVAGIEAITLEDVKTFIRTHYTRANLTVGLAGDAPQELVSELQTQLSRLPAGTAAPKTAVTGRKPDGLEVEIIEKDTRAVAISFGHPIEVTRAHADFPALSVARAWLGEHRSSVSHLYERIREVRGMNYGDYAYIEAFPRGMFQFFPDPNLGRRAQIFEVWIRPVVPENAHMAIRIAINELDNLISKGLSQEDFEATRNYLMKNVAVMTATQNQQIGYALDSRWYGIGDYATYMRTALSKLTRDDVNRAVRKHLDSKNLFVVIIAKDAKGVRDKLISDEFSAIKYEGEKPKELLDEDKIIGARKLGIRPENIRIVPAEQVFAK